MNKKMIKKSSYQILKSKIFKLENDIHTMIMDEESLDAVELKTKYRLKFEAEDSVFFGKSPIGGCVGIWNYMKRSNHSCIQKIEPIKINSSYFDNIELPNWDIVNDINKSMAKSTAKKREELITKALKEHGYVFQNKQQLYEFAKQCEIRKHDYDTIQELWYENDCICIWDEIIDIKHEKDEMTITQQFAVNPKNKP